jgi:mRNA interferase MazF
VYICRIQFDVVKVPFTFTELPFTRLRPAVLLSNSQNFTFSEGNEKCVLAMIPSSTHKPWPLDTHIANLKATGLSQDPLIRLKVFTLDRWPVLAKIGALSRKDSETLRVHLSQLFAPQENA